MIGAGKEIIRNEDGLQDKTWRTHDLKRCRRYGLGILLRRTSRGARGEA